MGIPNIITLTRIVLIPIVPILYLLPIRDNGFWAGLLFSLICCTDFIDGALARKSGKVTTLGKLLDPLADKIAATTGLFLLVYGGLFSYPDLAERTFDILGLCGCIVIISRDFGMGVLRQVAITKGVVIHAGILGKIKTVVMDFAIPILMVSTYHIAIYIAGITLYLISVMLSLISFIYYLRKNSYLLKGDSDKKGDT